MQFSEIRANALRKLGEATATFYSTTEMNDWINQGQLEWQVMNVFAFERGLTTSGALEKTATVGTTAADWRIRPHTELSDFIWPTRVVYSNDALTRIESHKDLGRFDVTWTATAGDPKHWGMIGLDLMFVYPVPATSFNLSVTYFPVPTQLSADADVPEMPIEFHYLLEEYAAYMGLLKEGKAKIAEAVAHYNKFLEGVSKDFEPLPRKQT
jgi:hypothetical protein